MNDTLKKSNDDGVDATYSASRTISILMPTHNRADILPMVLSSFRELLLIDGWDIDMVVVANACSDDTEKVLEEWLPKLPFPAKCIVEPIAGSSMARNRAIDESNGSIVLFVDDDVNVPPAWLHGILEVFNETPADFVGGGVELWWHAMDRPEWFPVEFDSLLAAKDHGVEIRELTDPTAVITINLAFKREVLTAVGGYRRDLERRGKGTGSYEDVELNKRALAAGYRLFYAPNAKVQHWIEPSRVTFPAMTKMIYFIGQARVFAKPRLTIGVILRSLCGNIALMVFNLPGELLARIRGSARGAFFHRRMWSLALGGLVGLGKRLTGRNSFYS